ncbi:MAG: hypothetical protein AB1898_01060 [Acidobacteriota bacterium]
MSSGVVVLESVPDIVVGVGFFITLLVTAVFAGHLLEGASKARNRRALTPLVAMIDGSLQCDHQSGRIRGQYQGRSVSITMIPRLDLAQSSETERRINSFEVVLEGIEGTSDWRIGREGLFLKKWVASAPDEALRDRLNLSGLVSLLESSGAHPQLRYNAKHRTLALHRDVQPRLAPKPEQFRADLELLLHAVRVNSQINSLVR